MKKSHSTVRLDIDRVRERIAQHGYKYSALADSVGVSTNAVKNWLSGRTRTIYRKNAVLLASAFRCPVDEIVLDESPAKPTPSESPISPVTSSIFDHHIKVFGLVKASVTGHLSACHISEVRTIFANILGSLGADTENFGPCQIFVFNALHQTLPAKQVAHAIERLAAFQRMVAEIEGRFADHDIGFRMLLVLSDGNSTHHGLGSKDAYRDNFGKLLRYVDALAELPAGSGFFCEGYFHEMAATAPRQGVTFGDEVVTPLALVPMSLGAARQRLEPADGAYVRRAKVAASCRAHKNGQHLHLYGEMGSGKSSALGRTDGEVAEFVEGYRSVGPIFGAAHVHGERPAVLALVANYIDTLIESGQSLTAIKAFIRSKCADISPVIDSLLLSMLGFEPFDQRDRFFKKSSLDAYCYQAIVRILQLDSRVYPVVLLVDDFDQLDAFSRGFVEFFWQKLPELRQAKLLTTGKSRFQLPLASPSGPGLSRSVKLVNFTLAETKAVLDELPEVLMADTLNGLYRLTKGHPLLLAEIKHRWWQFGEHAQTGGNHPDHGNAMLPLALRHHAEALGAWDSRQHDLIDELKAANKPHQTLYFLLIQGLSTIEVEALQILAVAGFCRLDARVINHLDWTYSGDKKLSEILHGIAAKSRTITCDQGGFRFCHGLFHLAFKLSVPSRLRQKTHLVLHSFWEAEYAKRQAQGQQSLSLEHEKLLLHSRGCKLYAEYGRYACRFYDEQLRQGHTAGLVAKVNVVIKALVKATPTSEIKDSLCQLFLLKTKITFLAEGWTHPHILKYLLSCESHDVMGAYQPFVDLMKIYYYAEKGNPCKVNELFLRIDGKTLRQHVPIVYVAILCVFSSSTFMAGHLAKSLKKLEEARRIYENIGNSEAFIAHLDLDYGAWIYGSLAVANLVAGNEAKASESLRLGRKLCVGQTHLSSLGCFLLFENMAGALTGKKLAVQQNSKKYLRKTAQLKSAQGTIWPFYYWSVGNAAMILDQVAKLRSIGNNVLCSFFYYLAAGIQWQNGDRQAARETINQALTLEKALGQSFITSILATKSATGPMVGLTLATGPRGARR